MERQPADHHSRRSVDAERLRRGRLHRPAHLLGRVQQQPALGASGEKEGPYDWVPPNYWYDTTHSGSGDSTQTNVGGSWGFDSEQSAGDTVPTLDSINRFMSAADQSNLWQNAGRQPVPPQLRGTPHTGYSFGTAVQLRRGDDHPVRRLDQPGQYVEEAQVQNYENTRAQFEAFIDHANNTAAPSTGTIYWQMNKGWPSLLWNLYNNDGDQAGSYFGAQEANQPLHALYALDNGTVTLDNLSGASQTGLSVEAKVYSLAGACSTTRPPAHHAGQPAGREQRAHPDGADHAAGHRPTSSSCC